MDAAWAITEGGHALDGETWRMVRGLTDHVAAVWRQPDAGIWERREAPAHHVHSKLMAWVALHCGAHRGVEAFAVAVAVAVAASTAVGR